jgi:hypothetical protein
MFREKEGKPLIYKSALFVIQITLLWLLDPAKMFNHWRLS